MPDEQVSLWSSFDQYIEKGEYAFLDNNFEEALSFWREYVRITGNSQWKNYCDEFENLLVIYRKIDTSEPENYFNAWLEFRRLLYKNEIGSYPFNLMQRMLAKNFLDKKTVISFDLPTGIFCLIENKINLAKDNLQTVINHQPDNYLARMFYSRSFFAERNERLATNRHRST